MYRRILIPLDDSDCARAALREIPKIAADHPVEIRLIHVFDDTFHKNEGLPADSLGTILQEGPRNEGMKILEEARAFLAGAGIDAKLVLVESSGHRPAVVIDEHIRQWPADLVVMGTHGRRGVSRLILGSEAAEVVARTVVPVLLVRDFRQPE